MAGRACRPDAASAPPGADAGLVHGARGPGRVPRRRRRSSFADETPRAAEWPAAPPPGTPGVPRVTPRNYPLFNSEDSATGDSSQSRGGGGSIDWRP